MLVPLDRETGKRKTAKQLSADEKASMERAKERDTDIKIDRQLRANQRKEAEKMLGA